MFYLKEFLKITKENFVLTVIFAVSTIGMVSVSHNQSEIQDQLSISNKTQALPYFNALISSQTKMNSVIRRMKQLPGVINVQKTQSKSITKEISRLKKSFGEDVINSLSSINYSRVKVELENGIRAKSQNLIREYLTRLVGGESITMGEVRFPKEIKLKSEDPLMQFLKWFDVYSFIIFVSLWGMSAFLLLKPINTSAFIIEKFQRRSKTNLKIFVTGFMAIMIPTYAVNLSLNNKFEWFALVVVAGMCVTISSLTIGLKKRYRA
jgi:hypothetical protein